MIRGSVNDFQWVLNAYLSQAPTYCLKRSKTTRCGRRQPGAMLVWPAGAGAFTKVMSSGGRRRWVLASMADSAVHMAAGDAPRSRQRRFATMNWRRATPLIAVWCKL